MFIIYISSKRAPFNADKFTKNPTKMPLIKGCVALLHREVEMYI